MEFKHFSPIGTVTPVKLLPNFIKADVFNPAKNIPMLETVLLSAGLTLAKGAILKNTLGAQRPASEVKDTSAASLNSPRMNALGFPVFSNLVIKGSTYFDNAGKALGQYSDIRLDAVLIEMEREKNLIVTDIQGRDNSVIEFISAKSVNVVITGVILANSPGIYPREDVENLTRALNSNKTLDTTGTWFLEMLGVYHLAIKNYSIKQEEGSQEYQKFKFEAISDYSLLLKQKI